MALDASISLPLDNAEARLLEEAVGRVLHTMREELVHTDAREYRADLRARLNTLEALEARLLELMATDRAR